MLAEEMEHYLSEISRTIKPGGRCVMSCFLLNTDVAALVKASKSGIDFKYVRSNCTISNQDVPEAAVAYEETFLRDRFAKYRLKIIEPVYYGSWPGREKFLSYQDIILATKGSEH